MLLVFSQEVLPLLQPEIESPDFPAHLRNTWRLLVLLFNSFFSSHRFVLSPEIIKAMTRVLASAFVKLTVWRVCVILSVEDNKEIFCRSLVQRKLLSFLSLTEMGTR